MLGAPGRAWTAHIVQFGSVRAEGVAGQVMPEGGEGSPQIGKGARQQVAGLVTSTSGCRIALVDSGAPQVSSTTGTLLPPNTVAVVRCTPGQPVSAFSNDGVSVSLSITELTD